MLLKICWMLSVLALCQANLRIKRIVGGYPALVPEGDGVPNDINEKINKTNDNNIIQPSSSTTVNNIIYVQDQYRTAEILGVEEPEGVCAFKGIRYAEPPVGRLRFQRPVFIPLNGKYEATKYGPPCPQLSSDNRGIVGSEDCLFLNVFTPLKKNCKKNYPVMIWIHGGGLNSGSALQYGVSHLVKKDVIVVTIQYRLGSLGWITNNLKELSGNMALFDMRIAIKWTKEYISFFNGDPERIVLAGQGSGASAATLLSMTDFTKGMLSGVFALSGSPVSPFAVDSKPEITYSNITKLMGCNQAVGLEVVKCLQMLSLKDIISADTKFENMKISNEGYLTGLANLLSTGPVVEGKNDGRFLPFLLLDTPLNLMKMNRIPKIPILTGVNKLETKSGILGKYRAQVQEKLTQIPDYINKVLPNNILKSNSGLFKNGNVNNVLQSLFENNNYLKLVSSSLGNTVKDFEKVVQGTTDALFNLPAFFTSHLWSKHSSSYFYSFEYKSKSFKTPGKWFLPNILGAHNKDNVKNDVGNTHNSAKKDEDTGEPGHGDELIYLYDVRSIEGMPIPGSELKDQSDIEMRDNFTSLVAEFIHHGKPRLSKLDDEWPSFTSAKRSDYVILSENSRIEKKFRFCEMGLWGGLPDILQSSYCNFPGISDILKTVPDLLKEGVLGDVTSNAINALSNPLNKIAGLVNTDHITPGLINLSPNKPTKQNNQQSNGGLPLLGGVPVLMDQRKTTENKRPTQRPGLGLLGKKKK
ncbi:carboxylesterase 4A [Adelges cooleyi]|uniref:carboxylesterase 4A n=1 Tax=Adelges cooleyi TaxID=133065 RepID=UPI00217F6C8C|nr:carboxylesterase 4A [Adelges cooleyi]